MFDGLSFVRAVKMMRPAHGIAAEHRAQTLVRSFGALSRV